MAPTSLSAPTFQNIIAPSKPPDAKMPIKMRQSAQCENFLDFSITQILREINFVNSKSAKTAVFCHFRGCDFVHLVIFSLQKVQKCIEVKIQSL